MQPQHLRMGHRDGMPRSVHKLRLTPCMPVRPGYMRRVGYPGIHGRHVNVLYAEGADLASWVLVYAVFARSTMDHNHDASPNSHDERNW